MEELRTEPRTDLDDRTDISLPPNPTLPLIDADTDEPDSVPQRSFVRSARTFLRDYFLGEEPTVGAALVPFCFLSILLFTRHPLKTNFIFDEQEAILANPYVRSIAEANSKLHWLDAFRRDFWGLPHDRSIGSYRPIPDLIWRALWGLGARDQTPFLHHWVNVVLHALNAALLTVIVSKVTKDRALGWLSGLVFVACAVLTEAVSGVVGIADVLGALGVLLAVAALALPMYWMVPAVFLATLFGLFSKESALCAVPLVPLAALFLSRYVHPVSPRAGLRTVLAGLATVAAFVLYVESRRRLFPAPLGPEISAAANANKPFLQRTFAALLRWYAQPILPRDPLNNPLIEATPPYRVAAGLRIYADGLSQIVFPRTLSGDYSAPQEPIPSTLVFPASVAGAVGMVAPLLAAPVMGIVAWRRAHKWRTETGYLDSPHIALVMGQKSGLLALLGVAMVWVVVSYFPVSNIPILLPTVRAERFWYFPALGTSIAIAAVFITVGRKLRRTRLAWATTAVLLVFLVFQAYAARMHANDYTDDLVFWNATRHAVPRSAKAHLNYSVMQGARGRLEERRAANAVALDLAPTWPMANVYLGDTLCRMHRADEAWPYYKRGFELSPNDQNLIALAIQCLWDEKKLQNESSLIRNELEDLATKHPGTWVSYLARDTIDNGESHEGVDPQYRPRGYNQGPKEE
ncbi:tetratricopeptide repeat protein [Pendulispora brunnea]|uniref:Tetratricopeptide repeat protein n=1 Tax=Pendulispora brunnea TaxID=2905690 RepID=A0ABZ2K7Y7_9BACT